MQEELEVEEDAQADAQAARLADSKRSAMAGGRASQAGATGRGVSFEPEGAHAEEQGPRLSEQLLRSLGGGKLAGGARSEDARSHRTGRTSRAPSHVGGRRSGAATAGPSDAGGDEVRGGGSRAS